MNIFYRDHNDTPTPTCRPLKETAANKVDMYCIIMGWWGGLYLVENGTLPTFMADNGKIVCVSAAFGHIRVTETEISI